MISRHILSVIQVFLAEWLPLAVVISLSLNMLVAVLQSITMNGRKLDSLDQKEKTWDSLMVQLVLLLLLTHIVGSRITVVGSSRSVPPEFKFPYELALHPSGKVVITEPTLHRIQVRNPDLSLCHMIGSTGNAPKKFNGPWDVACDSQGMIYVTDSTNSWIQKFTPEGEFVATLGEEGAEREKVRNPFCLAIDRMDNVYVGEAGNDRVSVFTSNGDSFTVLEME